MLRFHSNFSAISGENFYWPYANEPMTMISPVQRLANNSTNADLL